MKKQKYNLTDSQLEKLNILVKKSQRVRRYIKKRNAEIESSVPINLRPDLIEPKMYHKYSKDSFNSLADYRRLMKKLSTLYSKESKSYFKETYKKNYLNALLDMINSESTFGDTLHIDKPGYESFGRFSKEFLAEAPEELRPYLELYNKINNLPISQFMNMYDRGFIVMLKYIYRDMIGDGENTFLDEQIGLMNSYKEILKKSKKSKSKGTGKETYKGRTKHENKK